VLSWRFCRKTISRTPKAGVEGQRRVAEDGLRYFILVVALLPDPAAVLLLLAVARSNAKGEPKAS
jgi:hypothetical protein